ncbi:MAG: hypothetical protein M1818_004684 [Claussenomyces sp. TS43310]|nr:MAG: hypothetical protein M1818_004684 [Claussenomyces sp. TS43310]
MAAIYAIGSNSSGQLGIGHKEDVSVPKEVLFHGKTLIDIQQPRIRAGGNHTLLLSSDGYLYCAGDCSSGACGLAQKPEDQIPPVFNQIQLSTESSVFDIHSKVTHCAATWEASIIAVSRKDDRRVQVYSFGTGNKGELGLGELIFHSSKAQLIKDFPPAGTDVVDLAASVSHVVVVLSNGEVYGWGSGRKGQIGQPESIVYSPRKISSVGFNVARAVCGREFTYLVSASGGEHCVLGSDKWNIRRLAPANVKGWKELSASWGSIFVLKTTGEVLSWGRNDHGQLVPDAVPKFSHIAAGSEHAVALSVDGDVLAWGWGEHGNCGPTTINGDVKGKWNIVASSRYLPEKAKIIAAGAGCATSWIFIGT